MIPGFHTDAFNSAYWNFAQCLDWAAAHDLGFIECGAIDGVSWIHGLGYQPHIALWEDPLALRRGMERRGVRLSQLAASEIHGYNLDGHFDIQELNKTGKLDKQVRRIQAADWAQEKAKEFTYGTVKLLIDTDGDGRVDQSHVFADKLPACYSLVPSRDGIIALCAPDIYFLADRDGDGNAEVREQLFTGLNEGELWSRANHLVLGLDK